MSFSEFESKIGGRVNEVNDFRIVYEEDGYPRELSGLRELARALQGGSLQPSTRVTVYRQGEPPSVRRISDLPELATSLEASDKLQRSNDDEAVRVDTETAATASEIANDDLPFTDDHAEEPSQEEELSVPAYRSMDRSVDADGSPTKWIVGALAALILIVFLALATRQTSETAGDTAAIPAPTPTEIATVDDSEAIVEGVIYEWKQNEGKDRFRFEDLTISFAATPASSESNAAPVITVRVGDELPQNFTGIAGFETAQARFALIRPNKSDARPSLLFMSFSGGAHCCTDIKVISVGRSGWQVADLGTWDGEGFGTLPSDINDDGKLDFVLPDNAFLYAFASYSESYAPSVIYNLSGAKFVDVSASPQFRSVHLADMTRTRPACGNGQNGACAAFLASALRAGEGTEAARFVAISFNQSFQWDLPSRCSVEEQDGSCPAGEEIKPSGFLQALQWFLEDNAYLDRAASPTLQESPLMEPSEDDITEEPEPEVQAAYRTSGP